MNIVCLFEVLLQNSLFTLRLRMRNNMRGCVTFYFNFVEYWDTYEKMRGILSNSGTLKICRMLGLVEYWDCTNLYPIPIIIVPDTYTAMFK